VAPATTATIRPSSALRSDTDEGGWHSRKVSNGPGSRGTVDSPVEAPGIGVMSGRWEDMGRRLEAVGERGVGQRVQRPDHAADRDHQRDERHEMEVERAAHGCRRT
jgi:hypothetical protein